MERTDIRPACCRKQEGSFSISSGAHTFPKGAELKKKRQKEIKGKERQLNSLFCPFSFLLRSCDLFLLAPLLLVVQQFRKQVTAATGSNGWKDRTCQSASTGEIVTSCLASGEGWLPSHHFRERGQNWGQQRKLHFFFSIHLENLFFISYFPFISKILNNVYKRHAGTVTLFEKSWTLTYMIISVLILQIIPKASVEVSCKIRSKFPWVRKSESIAK